MSNKMNSKEPSGNNPAVPKNSKEKSSDAVSTTLIQKDLPQHHLNITPEPLAPAKAKEKWSFLKSNLQSAVSDWAELEKQPTQKTPEEEQLDKMRSLITNLKERLAEF